MPLKFIYYVFLMNLPFHYYYEMSLDLCLEICCLVLISLLWPFHAYCFHGASFSIRLLSTCVFKLYVL